MKNTNLTEHNTAMKDSHLNQQTGNKPLGSRLLTLILAGLVLPLGSLTFSGCGKDEQAEMKEAIAKETEDTATKEKKEPESDAEAKKAQEEQARKEAIAKEMAKPIQHRRMMPDDMTLDEIIQQLKKYAKMGDVEVQERDRSIYGQDPSYHIFRDDEELLMHYDLLCNGLETINDYSYLSTIVGAAKRGPNSLPTGRYIISLIHLGAYHSLNTGLYSDKLETKTVKMILDDYKKRPDLYPKDFINIFFSDIAHSYKDDEKGSEQIKLVLEAGADSNTKLNSLSGFTALMNAALRGCEKTAKLLLEHGADVNAKAADGMTALMFADYETTKLLLEHGADVNAKDNDGKTALMRAAEWDSRESSVKLLLEHGADVNAKTNSGRTALMRAASVGREKTAKLLLEHGSDVNAKDNDGKTALMFAAGREELLTNTKVVRLLLEHGAEVNAKNETGKTALMLAAQKGNVKCARILLDNGADVNAKDSSGQTALMFADAKGSREAIIRLLLDHGANVNAKDNSGRTALMFADYETTKLLLEHGADVNAKTNSGRTALMRATSVGREKNAKLLLEHGADVNAKDNDGKTALMFARENGHWGMAKFLREHGADDRTEK